MEQKPFRRRSGACHMTARPGTAAIAALAIIAAAAFDSGAALRVVDQAAGNDAASGTASQPWKTLGRAAAMAQPGDSVLVMPGTYSDPGSDPFRAFNPARSGVPGAPIVFKSFRRHAAVLTNPNRNHPAMGINTRSHIVIDGFKVVGGIGFRDRSDHGVIRNCDVSTGFIQEGDVSLHWGIYLAGSSHCTAEHNRAHSPGGFGNKTHNGAALMVIGVPAPARNNLIQHNDMDGGGNIWYNAYGQKAGLIHDNTWRRNIARNAVTGFMGMGSTDMTRATTGNVFQENLVLNCKMAFELDRLSKGFRIFSNTAHNCPVFLYAGYRPSASSGNSETQVWNNLYVPSPGTGAFYKHDVSGPDWKSLLAYSDHNGVGGATVAAWNYGSGSLRALADWRSATGFDAHSLPPASPFLNAAQGDFHLAAGSVPLHAGLDRNGETPGYGGAAPDLGAYPGGPGNPLVVLGHTWGNPVIAPLPPPATPPAAPVNLGVGKYNPIPD